MGDVPGRLERAMKLRGLNQPKLAELSGVSQPTIQRLLAGTTPGVGAYIVAQLAEALDVTTDWLLLGVGEEIPKLSAIGR